MASGGNEQNMLTNNSMINCVPNALRKSVLIQDTSLTLSENDDEKERLARRYEISAARKSIATSDRRKSLGLTILAQMSVTEMFNHMNECIRLGVENKINVKNAFNLRNIDFMTYMIQKHDENMSNLQVATAALDVSTKIYGYRVDGIHTEIMKLAGGLDKQDAKNNNEADESTVQDDQTNDKEKRGNKKKSKYKHKSFSTAESLKGTLEIQKPTLWMMENEDNQTADTLYQAMLPNHANSGFHLHLYNDVIADTVKNKKNFEEGEVNIPKLDLSNYKMCPPLNDFEFSGWTEDNESEFEDDKEETVNENRFRFDLEANIPPEEEIDHHIDPFDIDEDENEEHVVRHIKEPAKKQLDLHNIIATTGLSTSSEYSFLTKIRNSCWAGPAYWKISNVVGNFGDSNIEKACPQKQGTKRKKKELTLSYDDDLKKALENKFKLSSRIRFNQALIEREWLESSITLPQDFHYDPTTMNKLYLHKLITIDPKDNNDLNTTCVSDDIDGYNYDNDNDTSNYCPNVPADDYDATETYEHRENFGSNLVAIPKLTNAVSIPYSVRAKRIDMRQLKKSIWKHLIEPDSTAEITIQEEVEQRTNDQMKTEKKFSEIYKKLPKTLTKTNAESLSFPISFVSLLHLANEKTLKIESLPDMSDIVIFSN